MERKGDCRELAPIRNKSERENRDRPRHDGRFALPGVPIGANPIVSWGFELIPGVGRRGQALTRGLWPQPTRKIHETKASGPSAPLVPNHQFFFGLGLIHYMKEETMSDLLERLGQMGVIPVVTIAEVEELVAPGELDPDQIHTPGVFVHRVIKGESYEKPIEQRTVRQRA